MTEHSPQTTSVYEFYRDSEIEAEIIEGREFIQAKVAVQDEWISLISQIDPETNVLVMALIMPLPVPDTHMPAVLELLMRANMELHFGNYEYDFNEKSLIFRMTNVFTSTSFDRNILANMFNTSFNSLDELCHYLISVIKTPEHLIAGLSVGFMLKNNGFLQNDAPLEEEEMTEESE